MSTPRFEWRPAGEMNGDDHTLTFGEVFERRLKLAEQWAKARKEREAAEAQS